MDSDDEYDHPDLDKIKKDLHSLRPNEYMRFMKEVHFECPFKTAELTDEIVNHWKNDHSMKTEEFDKVVNDREAEHNRKAEENRQGDLTRIQNMKSRTGLDPLQIFPKEIWLMLLGELLPRDQNNFRDVHETFRDLTDDTLIGDILLPLVLGLKVERFWGDSFPHTWHGLMSQRPVIFSLSESLELRLVSKTLRNAVDRSFEDDIIYTLHNANTRARPSVVVQANLSSADDFEKFARMKAQFNSSKPRRFFTRSLEIISGREGILNFAQFTDTIDEILDHIGDQIWYFSFDYNHPTFRDGPRGRNDPLFAELYTSFLGWLSRMPNLKWLKFTLYPTGKESRSGVRVPDVSPPVLSSLERLDLVLRGHNRYLLPIYKRLLTAYSGVKVLKLTGLKCLLKEKNGFVGSNSYVLAPEVLLLHGNAETSSEFTFNSWNADDYSDSDSADDDLDDNDNDEFSDIILMKSIINSRWPLRRIDWYMNMGDVFIDGIFQFLGLIPTLENIRLSVDDVSIRDKTTFLQLPELTYFDFEIRNRKSREDRDTNWSFLFSFQFLLFAKKLKTLIWDCDMEEENWAKLRKDTHALDHIGGMLDLDWVALKLLRLTDNESVAGDIRESNIWRVFRSLETVILKLTNRSGFFTNKQVFKKYRRCELDCLEGTENSSECSGSSYSSESESSALYTNNDDDDDDDDFP